MTSQLAQFSSLEQLTQVNSNLTTLAATSKQGVTATLLGLIGKTVAFDGSSVDVKKGQAPAVSYQLAQHVAKVTATITDAGGNVVRTVEIGAEDPGSYGFQWDGRNSNGVIVPDGTYNVQITTTQPGEKTGTPVSLQASATVTGVDLTGSAPAVIAGGRTIGLDSIKQIKD
jgi:flagellar basal-body rod modification protein FlgD